MNLGFLGFFKYFNFFLDSFVSAFSFLGFNLEARSLSIVLPVGISFYTFQTLSYTIDAYRKKIEPTSDFVAFSAFVSFFPQLVAGPIERAKSLLPQFYKERVFDYRKASDGLRQILWGLSKKIIIADNCAKYANQIFSDSAELSGSTLVLGAVFFAFQIYGDFSGYSDIAIGTSRLFGFQLTQNFAFPYFSRDVAEFWRRWHISLSTWFRDYLYIPLGGSRRGKWISIRNIFIIFIVSGFWHGANWTFIFWGALNAFYFLPLFLTNSNRRNLGGISSGKIFPTISEVASIILTFSLTVFAWIFFRAESLQHAISYIANMLSPSLLAIPDFTDRRGGFTTMILITLFLVLEWSGRKSAYAIESMGLKWPRLFRWLFYACLIFMMGLFMPTDETPFLYFQF
ncbi:MAG: MBOAT family O-acyltransferase [Leptolyngbyaceae cyanobacterium]